MIHTQAHIHFIGIGGIGMSGIAEVLLTLGYQITGSDLSQSASTDKLTALGAKVFFSHKRENIEGATVVVYSSAIKSDNPEFSEAKIKGIPLLQRAQILADLMRLKKGIAIAGTHGKTTTTSLMATILHENSWDPTYIIGGVVQNLDGHARVGSGEYLVAEADESDGSFLLLNPVLSVITNIDEDHMEFYRTRENLDEAFIKFANKIPFYGTTSVNLNDPGVKKIIPYIKKPYCTFGIIGNEIPDYGAKNIKIDLSETHFDLCLEGQEVDRISLPMIGLHNVENSLASISIAHRLGLKIESIAAALGKFSGVGRRLQKLHASEKIEIIDDYGHHPTEIMTTIKAVKESRRDKRLVVIFEPHRYTRTRDCWEQFLQSFNLCDKAYILPIYPAQEAEIPGITSERLVEDINKLHPDLSENWDSSDTLVEIIKKYSDQKSVILSLGAGSIGKRMKSLCETML